ncbi:MAG: DNA repair protein RadA [Candidatus Melainabacteria bacterium]|nr:DNA repair protein RadA [Candidatus Melainabacteria bacterium]
MAKAKTYYLCSECEAVSPSYLGRCPACGSWNTLTAHTEGSTGHSSGWGGLSLPSLPAGRQPVSKPLDSVQDEPLHRYSTGLSELDRVLGGGILPGAYILIGGDPGIGKSTLMLQMVSRLAQQGKRVLYVAGEESPGQIRMRAERLQLHLQGIHVLAETRIQSAIEEIQTLQPDVVIIDSIQAMADTESQSPPSSVTHIKLCASRLMGVAKALNIAIVLIGHVTKEGQVSGPKLLEHMVDAVLYFEGDKYRDLRILRTVKNRFGSTQEIGVFQMGEAGLSEVPNPSIIFLSPEGAHNSLTATLPGCVTVCTLEGSRPLLVELQGLVGQSTYTSPRRVVTGVESNRLHQIVAVVERRLGLDFSRLDLYVNVVGGLDIEEPAADLGIAMALITSARNISVQTGCIMIGELGLTGELRSVRRLAERLSEAERIGFQRAIVPKGSGASSWSGSLQVTEAATLLEAVTACLSPATHGKNTGAENTLPQAAEAPKASVMASVTEAMSSATWMPTG